MTITKDKPFTPLPPAEGVPPARDGESVWDLLTGANESILIGDIPDLLDSWRQDPMRRRAGVLVMAARLREKLLLTHAETPLDDELFDLVVMADLLLRHMP